VTTDSSTDEIQTLFSQLTREWKDQASFLSSPVQIARLPAYQQIISTGEIVLPMIFCEMQMEPDLWFSALRDLTGADPVPFDVRKNIQAMTDAWLRWANDRGLCD
jgi:hypothetical protein